jgi:GLPGLI family protein
MKTTILLSAALTWTILPIVVFGQQKSSGTVDFEVTMQRNNRGGFGGNQGDDNDVPNVFTMTRNLSFNAEGAKISSSFSGRPRAGRPGARGQNFRDRGSNAEYVSFTDKQYLRAFKRPDNDTTFFVAQPFKTAADFQPSDKTKKIAGYTCHKATASLRNSTYTIWYTTDIPVNFSPVNGLIPPSGGFVLALQNDRMEYRATKVDLQDIPDTAITMPTPSQELSGQQLRGMRRPARGGRFGGASGR